MDYRAEAAEELRMLDWIIGHHLLPDSLPKCNECNAQSLCREDRGNLE